MNEEPLPEALYPGTEEDFRLSAAETLRSRDWRATYGRAKEWVYLGGAFVPETWLVYAASGIFHRQPRTAVHTLDMALGPWIEHAPDRAILLWARATVVRCHLDDPKTALLDYTVALPDAPDWLRPQVATDIEACTNAAARSRKRKPSVKPSPEYWRAPEDFYDLVNNRMPGHRPGSRPALWDLIVPVLSVPNGPTTWS